MKYILSMLLFGAFVATLVTAKAHGNNNPWDSDSDEDDDDEGQKIINCMVEMIGCTSSLQSYEASNITEAAGTLRAVGLRDACQDATEVGQCAIRVALKDACDELPPEFEKMIVKANEAITFICVDKIDDVEEHWQCLLNTEVDTELDDCKNFEKDLERCDTSPFLRCVEHAFRGNKECKPEAFELVTEVVNKLIQIMPDCSEQEKAKKFLKYILKRK